MVVNTKSMLVFLACLACFAQCSFAKEKKKGPIVTRKVFLNVTQNDVPMGSDGIIEIGLFGKTVPKTVENFAALCNHVVGPNFGYRNSTFFKTRRSFILGGDFTEFNGFGGPSIYGFRFEDENHHLKHYGAGWVSMANAGTDLNGSTFFITTMKTKWMDGQHVVFGKVIKGMDVVYAIRDVETYEEDGFCVVPPVIVDSGEIEIEKPFAVAKEDAKK